MDLEAIGADLDPIDEPAQQRLPPRRIYAIETASGQPAVANNRGLPGDLEGRFAIVASSRDSSSRRHSASAASPASRARNAALSRVP
jgi:hypothetical protein